MLLRYPFLMPGRSSQRGGAALVVVAGLLVMAATTVAIRMARQIELPTDQQRTTQQRMQRIQAALHAFATSQGRLPCPARGDQDTGLAVPAGAAVTCTHRDGTVPWVSLGLQADDALDGWGRKISYRVPDGVNGLTRPSGVGSAGSVGLMVSDAGTLLANQAWVLISHGASGLGAWRTVAPRMALPGAGGNEWNNSRSPPTIFSRREEALVNPATGVDYAVNDTAHFDDVVLFESIAMLEQRSALQPQVVRLTQERLTTGNPTPVTFTGRNSNQTSLTFDSGTRLGALTVTAGGGGTVSVNADGTGIGVCSGGCAMDSESALDSSKSLTFSLAAGKTADRLALGLLSVAPTLQLQLTFRLAGNPVGALVTYPASPQAVTPGQLVALENLAPVFVPPPPPPPAASFDAVVVQPLGASRFFIASIRFCTAAENCN